MTIRLLGTGGADGIPSISGDDPISRWAREHKGPDLRTRAAALVDDILKIDLPPDTAQQLSREGLSAREWRMLLVTHSDEDHLARSELQYALHPFTDDLELNFSILSNRTVLDKIRQRYPDWPMDLVEIEPFKPFVYAGYQICPIVARHTPGETCFNFIIERDGRRLLYATDTGVYSEETFDFLTDQKIHLLVIECTNAFRPASYFGHLDLESLTYVLDRLRRSGALAPDARVVTTHHSASGGARHCDLESALNPIGAMPGYDGMRINV